MKLLLFLLPAIALAADPVRYERFASEQALITKYGHGSFLTKVMCKTYSMAPVCVPGDYVNEVAYRGQPFENGTLANVVLPDGWTAFHRVLDQTATHIYLSGDNNEHSDGWISKEYITHICTQVMQVRGN